MINKIHCADSLEIMQTIPDKSIDFVITDPPYGINEHYKRHNTRQGATDYGHFVWDIERLPRCYFDNMLRVSKRQIIFGATNYTDYLPANYGWIVWHKEASGGFADAELAWTSFLNATKYFKYRWNGYNQENMKQKEPRLYPTQKPLPLMIWIIQSFTQPGSCILDPFCGSGTILVAARLLGRNFIGIDINPKACAISEQRLAQQLLPLQLPPISVDAEQEELFKDETHTDTKRN